MKVVDIIKIYIFMLCTVFFFCTTWFGESW